MSSETFPAVEGRTYTTARIFEKISTNHPPSLKVPVIIVHNDEPITVKLPVEHEELVAMLRNPLTRRLRWKFVGDHDTNAFNPLIMVPDFWSVFEYADAAPWPTFMCDDRRDWHMTCPRIRLRDQFRTEGQAQ